MFADAQGDGNRDSEVPQNRLRSRSSPAIRRKAMRSILRARVVD